MRNNYFQNFYDLLNDEHTDNGKYNYAQEI